MNQKVVAPCGIDCFNCELYHANVTGELQARISESTNIPKQLLTCEGCVNDNYCLFLKLQGKGCRTLDCVREKGVTYCFECNDFPCSHLMPLADGAGKFPHNMKLYNLCLMKKKGVAEWIKQAGAIRKKYFTLKMAIGEGGATECFSVEE